MVDSPRNSTRKIVACALLAAAPGLHCAPAGALAQTVPTLTDPNRWAVTGTDAARRFLSLARTRRVDIAIVGDSNVRNSNISGHEDGMGRAFAAHFGLYATRVDAVAAQGG